MNLRVRKVTGASAMMCAVCRLSRKKDKEEPTGGLSMGDGRWAWSFGDYRNRTHKSIFGGFWCSHVGCVLG